jgi:fumarate reductase iron-sulfur subunit
MTGLPSVADSATMAGMATPVVLRVFRWSPDTGERWQEYRVTTAADTTVLDVLVEIQRTQDQSLAFRHACRVGMCGSCALVVNGRERWACRTRLASLGRAGAPPGHPIVVRPLYHAPLLRDLVVDLAPLRRQLQSVGSALVPAENAAPYALLPGDSDERGAIDEAIECIGCAMCVSACTMVSHHPRFPGPAALNRAFTLQRDHRDDATAARWSVLLSDDALARCHGQANCTAVCPMGLSPATSIIRLRAMATRRLLRLS